MLKSGCAAMRELGVEEASTQFGVLLEMVERGEVIRLMRDGDVVAELTPPRGARERADRALAEVRERMRVEGIKPVDTETILEWVAEGRR